MERRLGVMVVGERFVDVLDVSGVYSLISRSVEERIVMEALFGMGGHPVLDLVMVVVDVTSFERNLYFL